MGYSGEAYQLLKTGTAGGQVSQRQIRYLATLLQIHALQVLAVTAQRLKANVRKIATARHLQGVQLLVVLRQGHQREIS